MDPNGETKSAEKIWVNVLVFEIRAIKNLAGNNNFQTFVSINIGYLKKNNEKKTKRSYKIVQRTMITELKYRT